MVSQKRCLVCDDKFKCSSEKKKNPVQCKQDVGVSQERSVLANLELKRINLIKVDVFVNLCWALLFLGVSGVTSARSRVNHLVLPAWSSVLQWPLDFPMFKTAFLPSYHSALGAE